MSVCMSTSVKSLPKAQARFLASRRTSTTPLWTKNTTSRGRWNSSRAGTPGGKVEASVGKRVKGWTTFSVLGLMTATAFGAHGFAKYQAEGRELRMRDYSSPEKWLEPKYASRKDMEDVSCLESLIRSRANFFFHSVGFFLAIGNTCTASTVVGLLAQGWEGRYIGESLFIPLQSLLSSSD